MGTYEKLIQQILQGKKVSYKDAEKILLSLGFEFNVRGSHHVFRKNKYPTNISLKKRTELLNYQIKLIQEVLEDHGYKKEK